MQPQRRQVTASASASDALPEPEGAKQEQQSNAGSGGLWWTLGAVAVLGGAVALVLTSGHADTAKTYLLNGPLGRSGFLAAFSLIFLSEIGDKTFFIAALLAMRLGRWIAFTGSVVALSGMTVISVGIGAVFSRVPDALKSSLPIGEIAGVALLVVFGIRSLKAAYAAEPGAGADEEFEDAQSAVQEAESSGKVRVHSGSSGHAATWASLVEVGTLVFLAEWGDRSMLATVALASAQSPVGVAVGACVGHGLATAIAVLGGALAGKYVSERTVNAVSGLLFLVFAAATVWSML